MRALEYRNLRETGMLDAKRPDQVEDNIAAMDMLPLSEENMKRICDIYERHIRWEVHHLP